MFVAKCLARFLKHVEISKNKARTKQTAPKAESQYDSPEGASPLYGSKIDHRDLWWLRLADAQEY